MNAKQHFVVIAMDGTDTEAPARRMAVRPTHLVYLETAQKAGLVKVAIALKDDSGERMIGSMLVFEAESREQVERYLVEEPYIIGKVWDNVSIYPGALGPTFSL